MNEVSKNKPDVTPRIKDEIAAHGAITLARFWELALYHPEAGYYEKHTRQIGATGDFITSVSVGPLLGRLLAWQFAQWLKRIPGPRHILEAGAHDGQLALDLLSALDDYSFPDLEYWILEPSAKRRQIQALTLGQYRDRVRWFDHWEGLPEPSVHGIIYANELLDAFPCHRFRWNNHSHAWSEWGVEWTQNRFAWRQLPGENTLAELTRRYLATPLPGSENLIALADQMVGALPDNFTLDLSFEAESWWRQAAHHLVQGHLLTLDYGFEAEWFFGPDRLSGTARSFRLHHPVADCLADPGQQDLTSAVNFSALQLAGETAGLHTEVFTSQARFLTRLLQQWHLADGTPQNWKTKEIQQFKTLIHPDHFGRAFQVLVQTRDASSPHPLSLESGSS